MFSKPAFLVLILSFLCLPYIQSLTRFVKVLGFFREKNSTIVQDPSHLILINDTIQCEDIHFEKQSGKLFLACEGSYEGRFEWFPPLANFHDPSLAAKSTGSIHVVDPELKQSQRLKLTNFKGPFNTHGIDVIPDQESVEAAVYIFAVNHPPNLEKCPDARELKGCDASAASRIEIFHHVIGSDVATHLRSVQHPLISTPNDILAQNPHSFYVTNDHYYKEGALRFLEVVYWGARWSTTVFVELDSLTSTNPTADVKAQVAVSGIHNQNGLGRGKSGEILIGCAGRGVLEVGKASSENPAIQVVSSIKVDSTIDNPSYFVDPYANSTFDASGYVLAGLSRAADLPKTTTDPNGSDGSMVWYIPSRQGAAESSTMSPRLLFEDDGERIRFATAAVMVAIDPKLEDGQRWAWLFVTGAFARSVLAVKINLENVA
ncbi:uncharacterized protein NECHADRAFT_34932 [Fusarium vanettenii 77-13-4]|uniref:Serum paraoxonase/arylesterase n=1 Tax=Fusarium vanettenii (strain ATCC MYA-4622 / CBS 123669 / FGSC 9596 / NRRL 45880 / 77-13-4) TaxID=660122 RepID=C7ZJF1_FUSV7|nr:uncharacterized protein NECHADRAFT_34932 [Fusarium vanettenii 77-13-4]EEU35840.1 hypothetical protein NECHADRAFT_34932 [Fusarium vanettenii 77-13-4]